MFCVKLGDCNKTKKTYKFVAFEFENVNIIDDHRAEITSLLFYVVWVGHG